MPAKCEICGSALNNPKFSFCDNCGKSKWLPDNLKIKDTFYRDKHLKDEVFLEIPEKTAKLFAQGKMGMNKMRAFFCMVRNAYDIFMLDRKQCFDNIKPQLYGLQRAVEDRARREIIPESFRQFIIYYIQIALKSKEELYGFMELFRTIIAYSK